MSKPRLRPVMKLLMELKPLIKQELDNGRTYEGVAKMLNEAGYKKPSGCKFVVNDISRFMLNNGVRKFTIGRRKHSVKAEQPTVHHRKVTRSVTFSGSRRDLVFAIMESNMSSKDKCELFEELMRSQIR